MPSREVQIDGLEIESYDYPALRLIIDCGTGTYIRTFGDDIARALGTRAVMSQLQRTAIGSFAIENAVSLESLTAENIADLLIDPITLLPNMARLDLNDSDVDDVKNGRFLSARGESHSEWAAIDGEGRLVAILRPRPSGELGPALVFK